MDTQECVPVEKWLRNGVNVVATGLDPRPKRCIFETTCPIIRISRLCRKNKSTVQFVESPFKTYRVKESVIVQVGSIGMYEPRCPEHWEPKMKYIKLILGIQACVLGVLAIIRMLGELAFMGMELEFMADDYYYMQEMNEEMRKLEDEPKEYTVTVPIIPVPGVNFYDVNSLFAGSSLHKLWINPTKHNIVLKRPI